MTAFNSKWNTKKLAVVVRVPQTTQNLVISRSYFAEDGEEMYKDLQRTCTAIVSLINFFCLVTFSLPSSSRFAYALYYVRAAVVSPENGVVCVACFPEQNWLRFSKPTFDLKKIR